MDSRRPFNVHPPRNPGARRESHEGLVSLSLRQQHSRKGSPATTTTGCYGSTRRGQAQGHSRRGLSNPGEVGGGPVLRQLTAFIGSEGARVATLTLVLIKGRPQLETRTTARMTTGGQPGTGGICPPQARRELRVWEVYQGNSI